MLRLNVGCGGRRLDGYTGVDIVARPGADIVAPAHCIPLPDGSCVEVLAVHVLEHVFVWEAEDLLREWFRLLAPGGRMILEMPDLIKCCKNVLSGVKGKHPDQLGMFGLYGDYRLKDPLMMHKNSFTFATLEPLVRKVGFVDITEHETIHHAVGRGVRDFRLEACKPASA